METIGEIIGYLIALTLFIIKAAFRLIFRFFNSDFFQTEQKAPRYATQKSLHKNFCSVPDNFKKGEDFENYVRKHLFTQDNYTIVERTHNYETNKNDFVESTLKADFRFRHNVTGKEFFIEAKWRKHLFQDHLEFSKPTQLERYRGYAKELPLYVVIGLGGSAYHPHEIFLEHIEKLHSHKIPLRDLDNLDFYAQSKKYNLV